MNKIILDKNKMFIYMPDKVQIDIDRLNDLASHKYKELCHCCYIKVGSKHQFTYDIHRMHSVKQIAENNPMFSIVNLVADLAGQMRRADARGLQLFNFCWDPKYIFFDGYQYQYIYLPVVRQKTCSVKKIFTHIIKSLAKKDPRCRILLRQLKQVSHDNDVLLLIESIAAGEAAMPSGVSDISLSERETSLLSDPGVYQSAPADAVRMTDTYTQNAAPINETVLLFRQTDERGQEINETALFPDRREGEQPLSGEDFSCREDVNGENLSECETSLLTPPEEQAVFFAEREEGEKGEEPLPSKNAQQSPSAPPVSMAEDNSAERTAVSNERIRSVSNIDSDRSASPSPQAHQNNVTVDDEAPNLFNPGTTELHSDGLAECETTLLTEDVDFEALRKHTTSDHEPGVWLILKNNLTGQRVRVEKSVFKIGKQAGFVDYVSTNASVSRLHATIVCEDEHYYVIDEASTNGTMIEGVRIRPHEKIELKDGMLIAFGNESFIIRIGKG